VEVKNLWVGHAIKQAWLEAHGKVNTFNMKQGNYMSIKMIANGKARDMVDERRPFRGSNVWAEWGMNAYDNKLYVVYSYRYTFPLFVYDEQANTWYENDSQFSQTTSRHRTQCRPTGVETIKCGVEDMNILAMSGGIGLIERANKGEEA
jgi:hypothetical protein